MEREIGEPGEFLGGSMASRAVNIRPDMKKVRRLDTYHRSYRKYLWVSMAVAAGLVALGVVLYWFSYHKIGMGAIVVSLATVMFGWNFRKMLTGDAYRNGLLVPGVITAVSPLRVTVVAEVRNGESGNPRGIVWGVKHLTVPALTMHPERVGEQVPFVVLFGGDFDSQGFYDDYEPRPLAWGTDEPAVISSAQSVIDPEEWELAALMAKQASAISGDSTVIFFNEDLQHVPLVALPPLRNIS